MKRKLKKLSFKSLAVILSVLMILTSLPLTVFAIPGDSKENDIYDKPLKDVFEVIDRREENVKHFRLEDGSYTAVQYDLPVHYLDADGNWQDIDNTLSGSGSEYSTSNARIKFAKKITGNENLFTIHDGNRKITMSLDGAKKKTKGSVTNTSAALDDSAMIVPMCKCSMGTHICLRDSN